MKYMKFILTIIMFTSLSVFAQATMVKIGNSKFVSSDNNITITYSVTDEGVGMQGADLDGKILAGKMQFRALYKDDETFTPWTIEQAYLPENKVTITLEVDSDREFYVEAKFADILGNWQETPMRTPLTVTVDGTAPAGTVDIKYDIQLTISVN